MAEFPFQRIAIINRGEAAVRLIHAVAELRRERNTALTTIALHTEAERTAMFARLADAAVTISSTRSSPYLDYETLERALVDSEADAAWVGWGFVAEHPEFADLCDRLGVRFIGPSGAVMRRLGDKIEAKLLAEQVGVPVAPWSGGAVETVQEARHHTSRIGYPFLIKATAGGGGRGIRRVDGEGQLDDAFNRARDEAAKSFGDPTVFMESLVSGARHVEVQIAVDQHGTAWPLGVHDCSIQRRNQKVIEESASPVLSPGQNRMLGESAAELARKAGYENVGTVEFLYQPDDELFAFLEVNTRLQVEHPITELTTGIDLVKLQLDIAAGIELPAEPPPVAGHAIEARLNAEDPENGFAPAPGRVSSLGFASGPGVRVDTGIAQGDTIPPEYDAMVAKVMAWGRDRHEARARLIHTLEETTVVVEGGTTNKPFLVHLLQRPEVISGSADTSWLDRLTAGGDHLVEKHADVAVLVAAGEAYMGAAVYARSSLFASAVRGRPALTHQPVTVVDCRYRGQQYSVAVQRISPTRFAFQVDGSAVVASIEILTETSSRVTVGRTSYRVVSATQGPDHLIEVNGLSHRVSRDDAGTIRAPAPSLVIAVNVSAGQLVTHGTPLVVVEAMKMETTITAPFDGVVSEVMTGPSIQVDAGTPLLKLDASGSDADNTSDARIDFTLLREDDDGTDPLRRCLHHLEAVVWTVLGFDAEDESARSLASGLAAAHAAVDPYDSRVIGAQIAALDAYSDVAALSRNRRLDDPGSDETKNPKEYFHQYLRSLDVEAERLPPSFHEKLTRAFRHFGLESLDHSVDLERAAFRVFNAQEHAVTHEFVVSAVLDTLRLDVSRIDPDLAAQLSESLDRLIGATDIRSPHLAGLARSVRYETFNAAAAALRRNAILQDMRQRLQRLAADPSDATGDLDALLACPEPLIGLLAGQGDPGHDERLLEVLVRRLYRVKDLHDLQARSVGARSYLSASYHTDGELRHVLATVCDLAQVEAALTVALDMQPSISTTDPVSIEIYTTGDGSLTDGEELARLVTNAVGVAPLSNTRRITLSGAHSGTVLHHTFRPAASDDGAADGGFGEDLTIRGMHPMIAARLQMWRFRNFQLTRLESENGVYSYKATAGENPRDVRLVALAEVRDLSPARDAAGDPIALPEVERVIAACANEIRKARRAHDPLRRIQTNGIRLYVWPQIDLDPALVAVVGEQLLPLVIGLGVEEVVVMGELTSGRAVILRFGLSETGLEVKMMDPSQDPLPTLDPYRQKVIMSEQRGSIYPYELIDRLRGDHGTFTEYAIDDSDMFVPVARPIGTNDAGFVAGLISTPTDRHPEGIQRMLVLGDPTKSLGSIAEAECRMVIGACDLAEALGIPVEWYAVSAGARISMDTGTENMDWVSRALRRIIEFTQSGGEMNVVVTGINVGAQPYWNAEATMLMHTKGILIMTPDSAMVLTGKQALDYSGGVSAEDNFGLGGYDRIMGPNGQAQYWAPDLVTACELMTRHNDHAYVAPGERFPRPRTTTDSRDRDISSYPHDGEEFETVGEVFSEETNPGRKKPFDIRSIMRAVADLDSEPMERWADMRDGETGVIYEAHLGGHPVMMIGISSRAIPRTGLLPSDGPDQWTAGTLFPLSSKKIARSINSASGSRPLIVLANLSGFDGSPESLARGQLEYGAEIGRAIVNFDGPIVFCVVSRYHGGAFVVFSKVLHDNMEALAVEGTFASVLGGAPAAAVVFTREVDERTDADPRVAALRDQVAAADPGERVRLQAELADLRQIVRAEKLGEKAAEFDAVHTVQRARDIGSVDDIIPAARLRPELIAAVERRMAQTLREWDETPRTD